MGYNLKNTRNGKSISKITKWPSLRSLVLKTKLIANAQKNRVKCKNRGQRDGQ